MMPSRPLAEVRNRASDILGHPISSQDNVYKTVEELCDKVEELEAKVGLNNMSVKAQWFKERVEASKVVYR